MTRVTWFAALDGSVRTDGLLHMAEAERIAAALNALTPEMADAIANSIPCGKEDVELLGIVIDTVELLTEAAPDA